MSNDPIPHYIEPYKQVDRDITFEGELSLIDLPRLKDVVATDKMLVSVKVTFKRGKQQQPLMSMRLNAKVELVCQRCLDIMPFITKGIYQYMFLANEQQRVMLPENYDAIELEFKEPFNLKELIEDELLLAIPIIPVHEINDCQQLVALETEPPIENKGNRSNPFNVLAQLKRDPKA